ncbi:RIP metalloprotease RseP [Campylobacter sputorum]|uniref:RIP metalloprotease RseP n=1 Tax=Campylobacter sputorum TaxID=206 RepID=UPI00053C02AA|nr:RIP metalloprotease RseP [Campylobacter sputorum]
MKSILFTLTILLLGFWHYGANFLATILIISFLIFFHELGHFLAAKKLGVHINVFSIGFGEKIFSKKIKDTTYCISAIPLGGYVQLKGQDDTNPNKRSDDPDSYNSLSPLGRIFILVAGPFFNIFLAFLLYIALGHIGVQKLAPVVGNVLENSAALSANIQKGDKILAIDGIEVKEWDDISKLVSSNPMHINIQRNGVILDVLLTPKIGKTYTIFKEEIQKPLIGISPSGELTTLYRTGLSSLSYALDETLQASKLIFVSLEKLIIGVVPIKELGGIVAMSDITSKAASISLSALLIITALISVNLGILNLFPIPALDGGHILFNTYELIFKKPVSQKVFSMLTYGGMAFLFALMAFTIMNDIFRLAGGYN